MEQISSGSHLSSLVIAYEVFSDHAIPAFPTGERKKGVRKDMEDPDSH